MRSLKTVTLTLIDLLWKTMNDYVQKDGDTEVELTRRCVVTPICSQILLRCMNTQRESLMRGGARLESWKSNSVKRVILRNQWFERSPEHRNLFVRVNNQHFEQNEYNTHSNFVQQWVLGVQMIIPVHLQRIDTKQTLCDYQRLVYTISNFPRGRRQLKLCQDTHNIAANTPMKNAPTVLSNVVFCKTKGVEGAIASFVQFPRVWLFVKRKLITGTPETQGPNAKGTGKWEVEERGVGEGEGEGRGDSEKVQLLGCAH